DGGGDGIHWHDPLNWEADRLPTATERVIVDQPETALIVVRPPELMSSEEIIYPAGALDIKARMVLHGNVNLTLHNDFSHVAITESLIEGSLRFRKTAGVDQGPRITLNAPEGNHYLAIGDSLYLDDAHIGTENLPNSEKEFQVVAQSGGHAYNSQAGETTLAGRVILTLDDDSYIAAQHHFQLNEINGFGPLLMNQTRLTFAEGGTFSGAGTFRKATLMNNGEIHFNRSSTAMPVSFSGIRFSGGFNGRIRDTVIPRSPDDEVLLEDCQNAPRLITHARLHIKRGFIIASNCQSQGVYLEGNETQKAIMQVDNTSLDLGTIDTHHGDISPWNFNTGSALAKVILNKGSRINTQNARLNIDSLIMQGGVIRSDAVVNLGYVAWTVGDFIASGPRSVINFGYQTGSVSWIDLGARTCQLTSTLEIPYGTEVEFRGGRLQGYAEDPVVVRIRATGTFRIHNASDPVAWNLPENGTPKGWVRLENNGTLIKSGTGTAQIQGCIESSSTGTLDIQEGELEFVREGNPSWTCN
ncbi:MAG: hypothetical protein AAFV07_01425, partial [Bacteroidota bacterium]